MIPFIDEVSLKDKRVLVRLDLNTPLTGTESKWVADATRIEAALPTLEHILQEGAEKVVLVSHLGRPKGERDDQYSLAPVGLHLAKLLNEEVVLSESCTDRGIRHLLSLPRNKIILLENVRFHGEEVDNDPAFAKVLASWGDVYINDAFGVSHRKHASVCAVVDFFKGRAAGGFLLKREIQALSRLLKKSSAPLVAVVGGAKVADKIKIIEFLLTRARTLLVGGAMAYPFLVAEGVAMGNSRWSHDDLEWAKKMKSHPGYKKLVLPVDHVVAPSPSAPPVQHWEVDVPDGMMGLDIGEKTRRLFADKLAGARSIFWNGPMGLFENPDFAIGTNALAESVAKSADDVFTVVGGGDSIAALKRSGFGDRMSHISTGGGASLEFLQAGTLPALEALKRSKKL